MVSLFDGTDDVICSFMKIPKRQALRNASTQINPMSDKQFADMLSEVYGRLESNHSDSSIRPSPKLWDCRRAPDIKDHNRSDEKILEKAVASLAERGHMPEWFNQCSVASGITGPRKDKKRAIDLVHLSDKSARLIELKWNSDTPVYALFEILEYGLAYIFCRLHKEEFGLADRRLMKIRHIALEVVAPRRFFDRNNRRDRDLFEQMDRSIAEFAARKTIGTVSMSLDALAFAKEGCFIPFQNGKEVKEECRTGHLTAKGRQVRHMFNGLVPIWATRQWAEIHGPQVVQVQSACSSSCESPCAPGNLF